MNKEIRRYINDDNIQAQGYTTDKYIVKRTRQMVC